MYMKLLVEAKFGRKQFKKTITTNQNMRTRAEGGFKEFKESLTLVYPSWAGCTLVGRVYMSISCMILTFWLFHRL